MRMLVIAICLFGYLAAEPCSLTLEEAEQVALSSNNSVQAMRQLVAEARDVALGVGRPQVVDRHDLVEKAAQHQNRRPRRDRPRQFSFFHGCSFRLSSHRPRLCPSW